jgi:hypothetical protein
MAMKKLQGLTICRMFVALGLSFFVVGMASAQEVPAFTGKFTLANQVEWGKAVLLPGDYTMVIGSQNGTTFALVRDSKGRAIGRFINWIDSGTTSAQNALLIKEKGGQLHVYCLALASLGRVLVYDPALAREAVLEARASQTVPVMLAKR